MIKKSIFIAPFFVLAILAVVIIIVNVDGSESAVIQEEAQATEANGTTSKVHERKIENTEYPDFKSFVYQTYKNWNNLSTEAKYSPGLGDETYQLLQTTISETS